MHLVYIYIRRKLKTGEIVNCGHIPTSTDKIQLYNTPAAGKNNSTIYLAYILITTTKSIQYLSIRSIIHVVLLAMLDDFSTFNDTVNVISSDRQVTTTVTSAQVPKKYLIMNTVDR